VVLDQLSKISSLEVIISQGRDIIRGVQSRFVYLSTFPYYYEPMEDWKAEENTNIDVLEETNEN
jgi:hypothetical protein